MNSGEWITAFLIVSVLVAFPVWELIQLGRRRGGNKSARTMSQFIGYRIKNGSRSWLVFSIAFPILLLLLGVWLFFHWPGVCEAFGVGCELDV